MDNQKIKELVFKLLRNVIPDNFESYIAIYRDLKIAWHKENWSNENTKPFDYNITKFGPTISISLPGFVDYVNIELNTKEFLELQLILEEVYPKWVQNRAEKIKSALTAMEESSDFGTAQEQIIDD